MKINLKEIPILACRAELALRLAEFPPLSWEGYKGPRGFAELMSFSVRSTDIVEFSGVSERLGWSEVYVFRSEANSTAMGPEMWESLEKEGISLVSIGKRDICNLTRKELVCHFVWMCSCIDNIAGWERMVIYKLALKVAGIAYVEPVKFWKECGETDVVGMQVTESQFHKLTDLCASFCHKKKASASSLISLAKSIFFAYSARDEHFNRALNEFSSTLKNYDWS